MHTYHFCTYVTSQLTLDVARLFSDGAKLNISHGLPSYSHASLLSRLVRQMAKACRMQAED